MMLESWLNEAVAWLDAWASYTVIAVSLLIYGLTSLTLRVTEPTNLTDRLRLTHGMSSDSESQDDVVEYRATRLVLTSFRTASVIAMVIASMRAAVQLSDDGNLGVWLAVAIGAGIMVVLILMRAALNRVPVSCYSDIDVWLRPIYGLANLLGRVWPLKGLANAPNDDEENGESSSENTNDLLNVLHNLASKYKTAEDLMLRLPDVVAVDRENATLSDGVDKVMDGTLDEAGVMVVYEDSINNVVGTVSKSDILQQHIQQSRDGTDSELSLQGVFRLTKSQETDKVVAEFNGRREQTAVVEEDDGGVIGILTYNRLTFKLLSNGDTESDPDLTTG